jgi:hypothetical protein
MGVAIYPKYENIYKDEEPALEILLSMIEV